MKTITQLIVLVGLIAIAVGLWQNWRGGGQWGSPPSIERPATLPAGTWFGIWENRRAGTHGALRCEANPVSDGEWQARFAGEFNGNPFSYEIRMASKTRRGAIYFEDKAKVGSDRYAWSGKISGSVFTGKFKSKSRNHGIFRLER